MPTNEDTVILYPDVFARFAYDHIRATGYEPPDELPVRYATEQAVFVGCGYSVFRVEHSEIAQIVYGGAGCRR